MTSVKEGAGMSRGDVKIGSVRIEGRVRRDLGDVDALAESIRTVGLLHPIVLDTEGKLICGARRLEAFKRLGRSTIPHVVAENLSDALLSLKAERDENTCRHGLSPSESVSLGLRLEALEKPAAKKRQAKAGPKSGRGAKRGTNAIGSGKFPEPVGDGRSRDAVAAGLGMSGRTYEKAKAVVKSGDVELVEKMDRTGKVDGAHKEMHRKKRDAEAARQAKAYRGSRNGEIVKSDFRKVAEGLKSNSVALIFADPPYDRKSVVLYGDMASIAARVLVDGGSLVTYAGHYLIPDICAVMSPHLRFFWCLACIHEGAGSTMNHYGVRVKWKPLLWFIKGTSRRNVQDLVRDVILSEKQKDTHDWQQGEIEAEYVIEKLTRRGEMVFDPFCGSGTTAAVCERLGRKWKTCDVDSEAIHGAKRRLEEKT
jgi:ParB-like chromosome segregation protein Spo0J